MARRRASMREGPLAELFRATEAAQRQKEGDPGQESGSPEPPDPDATVESAAPFDHAEPEPGTETAGRPSGGEESIPEPRAAASEPRSVPAEIGRAHV